jgi:hypothetical protein
MNAVQIAPQPPWRATTRITTLGEQLFDQRQDTHSFKRNLQPAGDRRGPRRAEGCRSPAGPPDTGRDETQSPRPRMASARFLGYLEGLAHRAPDRFRLGSVGQRLVHRPAAEVGQHVVLGDAGRVGVAELPAHLLPEHSEPHGARVPALPAALPENSRGHPGHVRVCRLKPPGGEATRGAGQEMYGNVCCAAG